MSNDRYARYSALSGLLATVILVGTFAALILPSAPDIDASSGDWGSYFADHQSRIQVGVVLGSIGLFFFTWFLGSVRSTLAAAEGGDGRLATVALAGGILGIVTLIFALGATAAAALRAGEVNPEITQTLNDLGIVAGAPGAAGFTAFFAAIAIAGYRYRPFPAPVAGFSALAAITQPLALGVGVTTGGVFAADGILGGFLPILTFLIAMVTLSVALYRQPAAAAATGGRAT